MQNPLQRAALLFQQGQFREAAALLEKLAKRAPKEAVIWYNLGLCQQQMAKPVEAERAYRRCLKIKPDALDARTNLAIVLQSLKQADAALQEIERVLRQSPDDRRAQNLHAVLLDECGRRDEAASRFESLLQQAPNDENVRFNLAKIRFEGGDIAAANALLEPLLAQPKPRLDALCLAAECAMREDRHGDAMRLDNALEQLYPEADERLRASLAIHEHISDHLGAIERARTLLEQDPKNVDALISEGSAWYQLNASDRAIDCYERALKLAPRHPLLGSMLGLAWSSLGDADKAEPHLRRSIEIGDDAAVAWRYVSSMRRFRDAGDPDIAAMQAQYAKAIEQNQTQDVIHLGFALGKIFDDLGDTEQAWSCYQKANDTRFAIGKSEDREARVLAHFDRLIETFDRRAEAQASAAPDDPSPIFVVGMPRSGTTLTEQILSRHSAVRGFGELPGIERMISRLERNGERPLSYPEDFPALAGSRRLGDEAHEYFQWLRRIHTVDSAYTVDKMPFNFIHLWLIDAAFPNAVIVHCRRHPLDVILSNYFQFFGSDMDFIYDLKALTDYTIHYHRLMEHWRSVLGDRIKESVYEELVSDPQTATRRLINDAGLDWEDQCLDSSAGTDAVRTASIWQVRQGIYQSSRQRWRRYAKPLEPVIESLVSAGIIDYPDPIV